MSKHTDINNNNIDIDIVYCIAASPFCRRKITT